MDSLIDHYYNWDKLYPNEVNSWTFLGHGPWKLISFLTVYCLLAYLAPKLMDKRKPYDLRPWMVIYNGSLFGLCVGGLTLELLISDYGRDYLKFGPMSSFKEKLMFRIAYSYILSIIYRSFIVIFSILRKKQSDCLIIALNDSFFTLWVYFGIFERYGALKFLIVWDGLFLTNKVIFFIFSSPGVYFRPSKSWKNKILFFEMIKFLVLLMHSLLFIYNGKYYYGTILFLYSISGLSYAYCKYSEFREQIKLKVN